MARAPFKQFEIDSLGFVFLNHLSNNKPRAGGGGPRPLSIQTRQNCFEKHTSSKQECKKYKKKSYAATTNKKKKKKKKKRTRKSPLFLYIKKKLHGISLILDEKYCHLSSLKIKKQQQHDRDLHKKRSDVLIRHGSTKYRDIH